MDSNVTGAVVLQGRDGPDPGGTDPGASPVPALGIGMFAIGTDLFVMAGLLGLLAGDLAVSVGVAGLSVTVFAVAYAAGAPLLGAALADIAPRRVLIGSLLVVGLGAMISALATTMAVLLGARVLTGLAASVYGPSAAAAAVAAGSASTRGRSLAVLQGSSSVAMVAGAPFGLALAATLSWRAAFGLVAVLAAVAVLRLVQTSLKQTEGVAGVLPPSELGARLRPLGSPAVIASLGVTLLMMTASNSMFSYLGVLLGTAGESPGLWLYIGVFGLGGVLGTWWSGSVTDRWGGGRAALLTGVLLVVALAALPPASFHPAPALLAVLCWGFAGWGFVPGQQHRLLELRAGPAPFVLALHSSAIQLGFAVGALIGGLIIDTAGPGSVWIVAVACGAAGLVLHICQLLPRKPLNRNENPR